MQPDNHADCNHRGKKYIGKEMQPLGNSCQSQKAAKQQSRRHCRCSITARHQIGKTKHPKTDSRVPGHKRTIQIALVCNHHRRRKLFYPAEGLNLIRPRPAPKSFKNAVDNQPRPQNHRAGNKSHHPGINSPKPAAAAHISEQPNQEHAQAAAHQQKRKTIFNHKRQPTLMLKQKAGLAVK